MSGTGNGTGNDNSDFCYLSSSPFPEIPAPIGGAPLELLPQVEVQAETQLDVDDFLLPGGGGGEGYPEAEDTVMALAATADVSATPAADSPPLPPPPPPSSPAKRRRGRPRGSVTKNRFRTAPTPPTAPMPKKRPGVFDAGLSDAGVSDAYDLKQHTILLSPGEDLSAKLMSFAQHGNRNFYICSHYGSLAKATLRGPTLSSGSIAYEGHFQLISFSGSFIQSKEPGGKNSWTGGLTVTLSGANNRIFVGAVAGPMIAATNMQVIVCSFLLPNKDKTEPEAENTTETNGLATGGAGDGGGTSMPNNFGIWEVVNDPDTESFMQC